jgi:DDE family transposase
MGNAGILRFVVGLVKAWDLRRANCFGLLVVALMRGRRLGVAAIGRFIPTDTTDKHHIKAVDRFLANDSVDLPSLWEALLRIAVQRRQRLFVLLDWTDLHDDIHETLVASVSFGGRALPVAWSTSAKGLYWKSRNKLETSLCLVIKGLLPPGVELVVVADRGYCRASFLKGLRRAGINFIVRIRKDVHLIQGRGRGPVGKRQIARGQVRDLVNAEFGEDARVEVRCVITFGLGYRGKVPKQPWYLVTNLSPAELTSGGVIEAYRLRMRIEENFRDFKSMRFGFQLRSVHLSDPKRYDRMLAIATVALLLLVHIGQRVEAAGFHRGFKANTTPRRTHSLFQLGLAFLTRYRIRVSFILLSQAFAEAASDVAAQTSREGQ